MSLLLFCCMSDKVDTQGILAETLDVTMVTTRVNKLNSVSFLSILQIGDFLSGRSPLTINLGIGAHMMYVQLQLSAQNMAALQQHKDLRAGSSSDLHTGVPTAARTSPPDSSNKTTGSTSETSPRAPDSSDSTSVIQSSAQRPRTSLNSTAADTSVLSHQSFLPHSPNTSSPVPSTASLPFGCQHPSSPQPAATPVCSPAPTDSIPGPRSPASASTLKEVSLTSSTAQVYAKHNALSWFLLDVF